MIIVTGGAGFIGSHLVRGLNAKGYSDILIVDNLTDGRKFKNLAQCRFYDYCDKDAFIAKLEANQFTNIEGIFHQGACTVTTEWNGKYLMENNYEYSKKILHYCLNAKIPLYYASSAAIYGCSKKFTEQNDGYLPLNVYGYSKLLFDHYAERFFTTAQSPLIGLRYFNVYGPDEKHKGSMVSVIQHFYNELQQNGVIRVFTGIENYQPGEQRRDFIYVKDAVDINLWLLEQNPSNGIYNAGTGKSETFNAVAAALIQQTGIGRIEYEKIPAHLADYYQAYTQADITTLRAAGYQKPFKNLIEAIAEYIPTAEKVC